MTKRKMKQIWIYLCTCSFVPFSLELNRCMDGFAGYVYIMVLVYGIFSLSGRLSG
jgi:hypothetical protein